MSSQPSPLHDALARRFLRLLLKLMGAVLRTDNEALRKAADEAAQLFPDSGSEDITAAERVTPPELRWFAAQARGATALEAARPCAQCQRVLDVGPVKVCPMCQVVLHAHCYDNSLGGFESPSCRACELRCYQR